MRYENPFNWTESMSVGVRELDEQHRHLFALLNAEIAATREKRKPDDVLSGLTKIANYNLYHLSTEETYMTDLDCGSPAHVEAHRTYRRISRDLMEKAERELRDPAGMGTKFARELLDFTGHWHVQHITTMDTTYTKCFNDHGLH